MFFLDENTEEFVASIGTHCSLLCNGQGTWFELAAVCGQRFASQVAARHEQEQCHHPNGWWQQQNLKVRHALLEKRLKTEGLRDAAAAEYHARAAMPTSNGPAAPAH
jgi:hypothetical protein